MDQSASRASTFSSMMRDPRFRGSVDWAGYLERLKEYQAPPLTPDPKVDPRAILKQAIVEPSNSNIFEGLGGIPANSGESVFEGLNGIPASSQIPSVFEGFNTVPVGGAAPTTELEAQQALDPALQMAGGTPQESHSQFLEKARLGGVLAKHGVAGLVGSAPDLVTTVGWDLPALTSNYLFDTNLGTSPKVSPVINDGIDKLTGGATKTLPQDRVAAAGIEGGVSMLGGGLAGKGMKIAAEKVLKSNPSKWVERAANVTKRISKWLGSTDPVLVAAGAAGGATTEGLMNSNRDNTLSSLFGGMGAALGTVALGKSIAPTFARTLKGGAGMFSGTLSPALLQKNSERRLFDILKNEKQGAGIRGEVLTDMINGDAPYVSKEVLNEFKTLTPAAQQDLAAKHTKDYVKFLMEMEDRQGIELTAGELTASPKLKAYEDVSANNANVSDMQDFLTVRKARLLQKAKELTDSLPGSGSVYDFGIKVDTAMKNNLERLKKIRLDEWNKEFGTVVDEKIVPVPNLVEILRDFSTREASNEGLRVSANLAKQSLDLLKKSYPEQQFATQYGVKVDAPLMSPKQINNWLVGFNEDLRRIPSHKRFSSQEVGKIKAALDADLDLAAQSGNADAASIRKAREAYQKNSQIINEVENSYMQKKLENLNTPERITKAFQSMEPSEIRNTISFLEGTPEKDAFLKDVQKYYLQKAISAADTDGGFSVAKFLKELPKKEVLDDVFKDASMYGDLREIMKLMGRIKNHGAQKGGPQTAQRLAIKGELDEKLPDGFELLLKGDWKGALTRGAAQVVRGIKDTHMPNYQRGFQQVLISKERRDALIKRLSTVKNELDAETRAPLFAKRELTQSPYKKAIGPLFLSAKNEAARKKLEEKK